jgi:hypothetical protein
MAGGLIRLPGSTVTAVFSVAELPAISLAESPEFLVRPKKLPGITTGFFYCGEDNISKINTNTKLVQK